MLRPSGSWVAVCTPFNRDDSIDLGGFKALVEFQARWGTNGILVMGSTGETTLLSPEERRLIVEQVVGYAKDAKVPAFFGCTCLTTKDTLALARYAEAAGADGILLVVPPYVAPPQDAVYEFFRAVATSVRCPVAIYNNPSRVTVNIDAATVLKLAEIENVVADKEAMGNLQQLEQVTAGSRGRLHVLVCDWPKFGIILPVLALGGHGTANVAGNIIPKEMAAMSRPWTSWKDVEEARNLYLEHVPVLEAVYALSNPVAVKACMNYLGLPAGPPRRPLLEMPAEKFKPLKETLDRFRLKQRYGL
jgi:4-hydroxy-tetrahydrodipicolinate synthase